MKMTILPDKKKVYLKGDLQNLTPEQYIEKIFEELNEYKIEIEFIKTVPLKKPYENYQSSVTHDCG